MANKYQDKLSDGSSGPVMINVGGGTFMMGSDNGFSDEKPAHEVTVNSFSASQTPVTFDDYEKFCYDTDREYPNDYGFGRGRRPVINVSWHDAVAYAEWLREQTGRPYRLLTEEEWEYICRAGTVTKFSFGEDAEKLDEYAWYYENSERKTHPVKTKKPNPWGFYDMHGNVWEWTSSEYGPYENNT